MVNRRPLKVTAAGTDHHFEILPVEENRWFSITTREWEDGDPKKAWRVPLHGWEGGISQDRFEGKKTYSTADMDLSNPNLAVPPPAQGRLVEEDHQLYTYGVKDLRYGGAQPYGGVGYTGAKADHKLVDSVEFQSKTYFARGQILAYLAESNTFTTSLKDFGISINITSLEVFEDTLIIAFGTARKVTTYDGSTFTEASDEVFAQNLLRIGNKLWRSHDTNQVSNCITSPLTLTSWVPADPNEYVVGDTSYAIKGLIEYDGDLWVEKADGLYAPDSKAEFHNQTPQMANTPDRTVTQNFQTAFQAWGFLFWPTPQGLLRIRLGESIGVGPELTSTISYRWHITGGVQVNDEVYLVAFDAEKSSVAFILKMLIDNHEASKPEDKYIFHEIKNAVLTVESSHILATSVALSFGTLIIYGIGGGIYHFRLGRGGGRHIDDSIYLFDTVFSFETGFFKPTEDMTLINMLVGIDAVLDADSSETFAFGYEIDNVGSFTPLLDEQESGSGSAIVTNTSGYVKIRRYAAIDATGQFFSIQITGTCNSGSAGTDRPELRELWAFGYSHPTHTDLIEVGLYGSIDAEVEGIPKGKSAGEVERQWRDWINEGTILLVEIPDYEESRNTRFRAVGLVSETREITEQGKNSVREALVNVQLMRVDYADAYAD